MMKKIASNITILNTRVYNVWRLHIKNRLGFLLACSTLCAMQFNAKAIFLKFIYTAIGLKNCKH